MILDFLAFHFWNSPLLPHKPLLQLSENPSESDMQWSVVKKMSKIQSHTPALEFPLIRGPCPDPHPHPLTLQAFHRGLKSINHFLDGPFNDCYFCISLFCGFMIYFHIFIYRIFVYAALSFPWGGGGGGGKA